MQTGQGLVSTEHLSGVIPNPGGAPSCTIQNPLPVTIGAAPTNFASGGSGQAEGPLIAVPPCSAMTFDVAGADVAWVVSRAWAYESTWTTASDTYKALTPRRFRWFFSEAPAIAAPVDLFPRPQPIEAGIVFTIPNDVVYLELPQIWPPNIGGRIQWPGLQSSPGPVSALDELVLTTVTVTLETATGMVPTQAEFRKFYVAPIIDQDPASRVDVISGRLNPFTALGQTVTLDVPGCLGIALNAISSGVTNWTARVIGWVGLSPAL